MHQSSSGNLRRLARSAKCYKIKYSSELRGIPRADTAHPTGRPEPAKPLLRVDETRRSTTRTDRKAAPAYSAKGLP
jgi:hypothetical protein